MTVSKVLALAATACLAGAANAGVTFSITAPGATFDLVGPGNGAQFAVGGTPGGATTSQTINANTVLSQTFTATAAGKLDALKFVFGGGGGNALSVHLFQLNSTANASSGGYVPATAFATGDLLGGGSGLNATFNGANSQIATFDLTDADEVNLTAGALYAFEIWNTSGANALFVSRAGNNYLGGDIYQSAADAAALSATSTISRNAPVGASRDALFAAYVIAAVPEPTSLAALALGGVAVLKRRRRD